MNAMYVSAAQLSRPSGKPGTREGEGAGGPSRKTTHGCCMRLLLGGSKGRRSCTREVNRISFEID